MGFFYLGDKTKVLVDDEDLGLVSQFRWGLDRQRNRVQTTINNKTVRLHQLIMNPVKSMVVDHINGNALDNQRNNLRICLQSDNSKNRKLNSNSKTGFKGVTFNKNESKWAAEIVSDKKRYFLGYFTSPIEASDAYNDKAKLLHGEFARSIGAL